MKRYGHSLLFCVAVSFTLASCGTGESTSVSSSDSSSSSVGLASEVTDIALASSNTFKDTYTVSLSSGTTTSFDVEDQKANFSKEMNINTSLDRDPDGGADAYDNAGDHEDNYFYSMDFYNAQDTSTFHIIPNYQTYQQTDEYTCGACSALMALNNFGMLGDETESTLWDLAEGTDDGLSLKQVMKIFDSIGGFDLDSTYDHMDDEGNLDEDYFTPENMSQVIQENVEDNVPTLIDWRDWGGHWQSIIGYDNMGTETIGDDVIVVADSYDTSDHDQDGYGVYGYERFFYNWYPAVSLEPEEQAYLYVAPRPEGVTKFNKEYHSTVDQTINLGAGIAAVDKIATTTTSDTYEINFIDGSTYDFVVAANHSNFTNEMNFNDPSIDLDPEAGADAYAKADDFDDKYFYNLDIYNLKSTDTLTILENYKTYQQTNEGSCGPSSLLTALNYLGKTEGNTEETLWNDREGSDNYGTSLKQLLDLVANIPGLKVDSTYDHLDDSGEPDSDFFWSDEGMHMIQDYLKQGMPVLIGWNDWGGHWESVIGYDDMGTETIGDDVMIVADPYDTSDHDQDGYGVYGYERFFYNWTMDGFYDGSSVANEDDFLFLALGNE